MDINIIKCSKKDSEYLENKLVSYNSSKVAFTQDTPFIHMNYKIDSDGKIIAGIKAVLYAWNCLFIDLLFVEEKYRYQGYGKKLLNYIEIEAKKHQCHLIHLDTFDFQAKDFYLKNGFEVFGILPDCPKGHTRYYMKKTLVR
ncbi:GNAT family N-acetyltransferase [Chitinispirillales bacterium ANBcel5]|uniref:GNAT family N-acetyltransferase n=1 Tax=Cellulosispirillum alkaliphilum TaxID=3039283 RepID=UPI002A54F1A1|nr:GNAT family N-acetyltransferase [Chitinispirillales bacterium ANBcel5]